MTKNPIYNALAAGAYIFIVGGVMSWGSQSAPRPDPWIAPIAVMALFTLSAAVMGYLFCYQPFVLYMEGKKKQALDLFLKTTGVFGVLTIGALALLFTGGF